MTSVPPPPPPPPADTHGPHRISSVSGGTAGMDGGGGTDGGFDMLVSSESTSASPLTDAVSYSTISGLMTAASNAPLVKLAVASNASNVSSADMPLAIALSGVLSRKSRVLSRASGSTMSPCT